jgi:hypothetical protein
LLRQVTDSFGSYSVETEKFLRELVAGYAVTGSLVCDAAGNTVNVSGSSSGLGNQTDLALLVALRRQSQVILTSGRTFRADQYRFPKQADLAVLTTRPVEIEVPQGQRLLVKQAGFQGALQELLSEGYSRIHIEYGLSGMRELIAHRRLNALFLSSRSLSGVKKLAEQLEVSPTVLELDDLYIGLVAWQPDFV